MSKINCEHQCDNWKEFQCVLEKLFEEYVQAEDEFSQACLRLDDEFERLHNIYYHGIVIGKYKSQDPQTLNALKYCIPDYKLKDEYVSGLKIELSKLLSRRNVRENDYIYCIELKTTKNKLEQSKSMTIDEIISEYECIFNDISVNFLEKSTFKNFIYIYISFKNFKYHQEKSNYYNRNVDKIIELYQYEQGKKSQLHKYGLLTIEGSLELFFCGDFSRIYDSKKDKTLFIRHIPFELCRELERMRHEKIITKLSIRAENTIEEGKIEVAPALEALEFGQIFSLSDLPSLSSAVMFDENNFEDKLWVNTGNFEITFEEFLEDFIIDGEKIVTQVIHLKYIYDDGKYYIVHLDHEFIFYSIEEYEIRKRNVNQKGTAQERLKTFKIDESKIPFDLLITVEWFSDDAKERIIKKVPFIYFVLEKNFKNIDLLKEYFHKIT